MKKVAWLLHEARVAHGLLPSEAVTYDERVPRVVIFALVMLSAVAHAQSVPRPLGVTPSREEPAWLRPRLARLSASLGASPASQSSSALGALTLAPMTTRADQLSAAGRLDEAAALYDLAVAEGTRAPFAVADSPALVHAVLARASIGLARGEQAQADALIDRVLRWDPAASLRSDEDSPRLRTAFNRARARLGAVPPLGRDDLGERCDALLVARVLDAGRAELRRVDHCATVQQTLITPDAGDATLMSALALTPMTVSDITAPKPPPPKPRVYKRAWFWVTLSLGAAAIAGAGVAAWAATRPSAGTWNVAPHF